VSPAAGAAAAVAKREHRLQRLLLGCENPPQRSAHPNRAQCSVGPGGRPISHLARNGLWPISTSVSTSLHLPTLVAVVPGVAGLVADTSSGATISPNSNGSAMIACSADAAVAVVVAAIGAVKTCISNLSAAPISRVG
jgi:hypothetical protein